MSNVVKSKVRSAMRNSIIVAICALLGIGVSTSVLAQDGEESAASHQIEILQVEGSLVARASDSEISGDFGEDKIESGIDITDVIIELYDRLRSVYEGSGYQVMFDIRDFETIRRERFEEVFVAGLVTMPGGLFLDVTIIELSHSRLEGTKIHFKPKWDYQEKWADPENEQTLHSLSLESALQLNAVEQDSGMADAEAITRFTVTVGFKNDQRTYKAAIIWVATKQGSEIRLWITDHIAGGLEQAIYETGEPTIATSIEELKLESIEELKLEENSRRGEPPPGVFPGCIENTWNRNRPRIATPAGLDEHKPDGGQHNAAIKLVGRCECTRNCQASCSPQLSEASCREFGELDFARCHSKSSKITMAGDDALATATCLGGQGCFIRSCLTCITCGGLSITAQIVKGVGITFSTSGSELWDGSLSDKATCICEEEEPPCPGGCIF